MLKVNDISVKYGEIIALKGVSLEVNEGEIVSIIGSNGAGKTTTINTISGLLRTVSGSITFLGETIQNKPPHEIVSMGLVQVPEGRRLFPEMTIMENLEIGSMRPARTGNAKFEQVFELFPKLVERKHQLTGSLSGGEQQMAAIARALMMDPKLLMLDEPTLGLAPIIVGDVFDIIEKIRAMGTTVLLVEQNAKATLEISDRTYVLETGNVVMEAASKDMIHDDGIRKAYLGM